MGDAAPSIAPEHVVTRQRVGAQPAWRGARGDDDLLHSGVRVERFVAMHVMGAIFPITAGWLLFGWRAIGTIAVVVGSALLAALVWRTIGSRGRRLRLSHVGWMSLLMAMMLPAHLLATHDYVGPGRAAPWPILVAAGLTISTLLWLLGGLGAGRIHPVIVAVLLFVVLFQDMLSPRFVLKRQHAFGGDLLEAQGGASHEHASRDESQPPAGPNADASKLSWIATPKSESPFQSTRSLTAAQRLESFTGGHEAPDRAWISLESLVRDRLPPLEDLIVGGQPSPIGQGSAIAIIIGGLFLLYRGLIDYRVPLVIIITTLLTCLILPVPIVINESTKIWKWFALRDPGVGWPLGVTFANYEVMASPLLFTAFFLATAPGVRPMVRRARFVYAFLIGVTTAAFQLYISVSIGPYLALLAISLISPSIDRIFPPRTLV